MAATADGRSVAILAGGGRMPVLVAEAARAAGRRPIIFAIGGMGDPSAFDSMQVHVLRWGELGRLLSTARKEDCREAVFVGTVSRPDMKNVRPDLGGLKFLPRVLKLMSRGDHGLLDGLAQLFEDEGIRLVSPLDIAPDLVLPEGCRAGSVPREAERDIEKAAEAARLVGSLDIAQAAVAVGGHVIAIEDIAGTDALLERVAGYRRDGRLRAGGVLVKCLKPLQDGRHDLPTIGAGTAERAAAAGLVGVAADAGHTMLVGRDETIDAFRKAGLFLLGLKPPG
jgi:hypothetical protein